MEGAIDQISGFWSLKNLLKAKIIVFISKNDPNYNIILEAYCKIGASVKQLKKEIFIQDYSIQMSTYSVNDIVLFVCTDSELDLVNGIGAAPAQLEPTLELDPDWRLIHMSRFLERMCTGLSVQDLGPFSYNVPIRYTNGNGSGALFICSDLGDCVQMKKSMMELQCTKRFPYCHATYMERTPTRIVGAIALAEAPIEEYLCSIEIDSVKRPDFALAAKWWSIQSRIDCGGSNSLGYSIRRQAVSSCFSTPIFVKAKNETKLGVIKHNGRLYNVDASGHVISALFSPHLDAYCQMWILKHVPGYHRPVDILLAIVAARSLSEFYKLGYGNPYFVSALMLFAELYDFKVSHGLFNDMAEELLDQCLQAPYGLEIKGALPSNYTCWMNPDASVY